MSEPIRDTHLSDDAGSAPPAGAQQPSPSRTAAAARELFGALGHDVGLLYARLIARFRPWLAPAHARRAAFARRAGPLMRSVQQWTQGAHRRFGRMAQDASVSRTSTSSAWRSSRPICHLLSGTSSRTIARSAPRWIRHSARPMRSADSLWFLAYSAAPERSLLEARIENRCNPAGTRNQAASKRIEVGHKP